MAAFLDPPPYILAADRYSCSLARTEILDLGVDICIEKPLDAEEVCAVISAVLRRANRLAHPLITQGHSIPLNKLSAEH